MKKLIYKYSIAIIVAIALALAILIRNTGTGRFRYDALRKADLSFSGLNVLTHRQTSELKGDILVIELDETADTESSIKGKSVHIPPDSVLSDRYRKTIFRNRGPVILHSSDQSVSAKTWMVLSQTGLKNVFILTEDIDNEKGKEKFRPDTLAGPEF